MPAIVRFPRLLPVQTLMAMAALSWLSACASAPPSEAPSASSAPSSSGSSSEATLAKTGALESVAIESVAIHEIQGADHHSPMKGRRVSTTGVVTALAARPNWLFVQAEQSDADPATSEGLCIETRETSHGLDPFAVGQRLRVNGTVKESARRGELSVTCLKLESFEILAPSVPLPEAIVVGRQGRTIPKHVVDDDSLSRFEPTTDGIDFFESLEGMRIEIPDAVVVGPSSRFGDIVVVADGGIDASPRTLRAGLLQDPDDANPERLMLSSDAGVEIGSYHVGDKLEPDIVGTLSYGFGMFRVMLTEPLPSQIQSEPLQPETTDIVASSSTLRVGSFNLLNVAATDSQEKIDRLAQVIVKQMGAPDLLCVQEVQDDSGPDDDGIITAVATYERIIEAISALGGPTYTAHSLDPANNQDGGRPGANIRVGFLFNPQRLQASGDLQRLEHPAFSRGTQEGWSNTRRPLIGNFRFRGEHVSVIGLHLRSKGRDSRVFGSTQPPIRHSELQRTRQAAAVREWVDSHFDKYPDARIIVLGDFNETSDRAPLKTLTHSDQKGQELHDLALRLPEGDRYSFVFQGESLLLDHILVSESLEPGASIDAIHCCAEFAADVQASDHDPLVAGLVFP